MSGMLAVVDYGMGNIHSILKALRLFHPNVVYTKDPGELSRAQALVLPGDGAFAAAMQGLEGPLEKSLRDHIALKKPLFGICIGFQVLFDSSDETHSSETIVQGLGLVPGQIRRFQFQDKSIRIPHMGWNKLIASDASSPAYLSSYMYFIHSYRAEGVDPACVRAWCDYEGNRFPAIVEKDSIFACQFHPEKSGEQGLHLIEDWVKKFAL
jgi:glutamine amidotransferase